MLIMGRFINISIWCASVVFLTYCTWTIRAAWKQGALSSAILKGIQNMARFLYNTGWLIFRLTHNWFGARIIRFLMHIYYCHINSILSFAGYFLHRISLTNKMVVIPNGNLNWNTIRICWNTWLLFHFPNIQKLCE